MRVFFFRLCSSRQVLIVIFNGQFLIACRMPISSIISREGYKIDACCVVCVLGAVYIPQ